MFLNEKMKPFLVLILRFLTKKMLSLFNYAGSYKKRVYCFYFAPELKLKFVVLKYVLKKHKFNIILFYKNILSPDVR